MESFLSRYRNPLILVAIVLAQMIGLAVQVRQPANGADGRAKGSDAPQSRLIRSWVVTLISPFERVFLFVGHGLVHTWTGYIDLRHVRAQNRQLQSEIDRIRLEEASLAENARQDIRLQKLFGFQQQYVSKTVAAHVIGTSGTDSSRVLYIDKGYKDGIRTDMPVITPDGVVGKIRDVFAHTSQVLEMNDQTNGLGVILTQTRLRGILRGNATGQTEIIDVLPDERIQPGEQVVTSGGDQVYPSGLPVGVVDRVVNDPERNPYVAILVRPAVNLSRLDEVLVITQTQTTMPSTMQQDIATSEQKAADILAQRLPGVGVTQQVGPDGKPIDSHAPPPPVRPPASLHPDIFTPGATPPATDLTPGAKYPRQTFMEQPAANASPSSKTDGASTTKPVSNPPVSNHPISNSGEAAPTHKTAHAKTAQPAQTKQPEPSATPHTNATQEPQN